MSKFDELDARIVGVVRAGHSRFGAIVAEVEGLAKELAKPDRWGKVHHDRLVDSRLQHLRRNSVLNYSARTGWVAVSGHDATDDIAANQANAAAYVAHHLPELCRDLLEIKATGLRNRPAVSALADMLPRIPKAERFEVARKLIEAAALERVASADTASPGGAP